MRYTAIALLALVTGVLAAPGIVKEVSQDRQVSNLAYHQTNTTQGARPLVWSGVPAMPHLRMLD